MTHLKSMFVEAVHRPGLFVRNMILGGIFFVASCGSAFSATYYVAPSGSDTNSGTLGAPFRTVNRAVTAAQAGDTVYLRQGTYREDVVAIRSGSTGAPIVFRGYPGEQAVLCGSDPVTGTWSVHQGNIYKIAWSGPVTALFVDGHLMQGARWPNAPVDGYFSNFATCGTGTTATQVVDPNLPALSLNGARVHIIPGSAWVSNTSGVANYGGGSFGFTSAIGSSAPYQPQAGNLYYLYGSLALLDSAGEWFQDPTTNTLYLWTPDGLNPSAHLVEVETRKEVFSANTLNYLGVRDLYTFAGGIYFIQCNNCLVDGVDQRYVQHYTEVSGYGAEGDHNGFYGGGTNTWSNGSIQYGAGNGLLVNGSNDHVFNTVIWDVDYIATYRGCIQSVGSGHVIEYNTLHDSGRYCVWHGSTTGGAIQHNEMYHAGLITKDVGATYAFQANGNGLVISYNHIHDTHNYIGNGIYLDNGCSNFVVHHNVVTNCDYAAIKLNYASLSNQCYNNTLANCKYWTQGSGATASQLGTSIINNLGVGTGSFQYLTGTNGAYFSNSGTYLPTAFTTQGWGFMLAAGSGAIDKGVVLPGITDGFSGSAPDVGAFEYNQTAWSAGATLVVPVFPYPLSVAQPTSTPTRTFTGTFTRTATSTATKTATSTPSSTASGTPTFTPTSTRTYTLSPTPSPTATPSRTNTPTILSTGTFTPTTTGTSTLTFTLSSTPTLTRTSTPTATGTPTFSFTFTPSGTATWTWSSTSTLTGTPTGTPSLTFTFTPTVTDTFTGTPSRTVTSTPTVTLTKTMTLTSSSTWTGTATSTQTAINTWSSTPTQTLTWTLTRSPTAGQTASWTASMTPSPTVSRTPTASSTSSWTPSFTATFSPTRSFTPSPTATRTSTVTFTPTPTSTASRTNTATSTFSSTPAWSLSPTRTATPTPTFSEVVDKPVVYPNPWNGNEPLQVKVDLAQPQAWVEAKIYTTHFRSVFKEYFPDVPAGTTVFSLKTGEQGLRELANGLYYLQLVSPQGHGMTKLLILR